MRWVACRQSMSGAFSQAQTLGTCRSRAWIGCNSFSTSASLGSSASPSRSRCSGGRTRSSSSVRPGARPGRSAGAHCGLRLDSPAAMRLIGLAVILTVSLVLAPLAAEAQEVGRVWRIGVLFPAEPASPTEPDTAAFRQGLRDLGYVEGRNIAVEYRYAHGKAELYAELVAQLVRFEVNVMVVGSAAATLAAKNATRTLPIVMVGV